jgi:hypothetical protein
MFRKRCRQLRSLGYAFGQAGPPSPECSKGPMRLIIAGLVASEIEIVHAEKKTLRACGRVGPAHRRRHSLAYGNARSGSIVSALYLQNVHCFNAWEK